MSPVVVVVQHLGRRVLLFSQWTRAMDLIADYLDVRNLNVNFTFQRSCIYKTRSAPAPPLTVPLHLCFFGGGPVQLLSLPYVRLDGSTSAADRTAAIHRFNKVAGHVSHQQEKETGSSV